MIHDNETNNQTSGLHVIAEQQKQLSRPSEYTLPHPFSMGERPKNIDRDDVPSRDVNRRVGGDEKFGVKYEKKKYFDVCNNCGKQGHTFKQCKNPITSFGVIVFRINPLQQREYLMIRRKDTLGYIDFMRGKYSASNQKYIFNMIEQMTIQEKYKLKKYTFDELWHDLWIEEHSLLSTEDGIQPDASTTLALPKTTASSGKGLQASSLLTRQVTLSPNEFGQRAFTPSHSGLRPPNTTKSIDDLRSEDRRSSTFWSSEDFGGDRDDVPETRRKDVGGFSEAREVETSTEGLDETVNPEETTIDTSTIYQTYKQEEMNSRDKFIYLTTKNIKDIPHQSNLLPYLQKMSCKNDHVDDDTCDTSITKFKGCKALRTHSTGSHLLCRPGEFWESREDKGAISILHYLIELSIQNSTNGCGIRSRAEDIHAYSEGQCRSPEEYDEQDPIQDLNEESLLHRIRDERSNIWTEPEWGFPKGRRNFQEKDYDCALREMTEETGYPLHLMKNMKNILPFDEIFLGSNYKSYKHRYYLMYMNYEDSHITDRYDRSEVSMMRWKTYEDCLLSIRPYNLEKKRLIKNIEITLSNYLHTATGLPKTYSHR